MDSNRKYKFKCFVKATIAESGDPRYSFSWVKSRRAWLKLYDNSIRCGNWNIDFEDIKEATIYKTKQYFIPVYVLKIVTNNTMYQFGMNPWVDIRRHIPFEYKEEKIRLKYSIYSILIRCALLAYLGYMFWEYLQSG